MSEVRPEPDYLKIAAADMFREGLPELSDRLAQGFYADVLADADLVAVDNLSTLCRSLQEMRLSGPKQHNVKLGRNHTAGDGL